MAKNKSKQFKKGNAHGASSKFGQLIGEIFAEKVVNRIEKFLATKYPDYVLMPPEKGASLLRLKMFGGTPRQMDNVIALNGSSDPVALFESKWLKDARHHNDKGAWILQLKEVRKTYPTVRGAAAILAGYWTDGVGVMFESEAGVRTTLVATDKEVYSTLETPLNNVLKTEGLPLLKLDAVQIRNSLPHAWDLANALITLKENEDLDKIADQWFDFERSIDDQGNQITGGARIKHTLEGLLVPIPDVPMAQKFEIALQINSGNIIYQEFAEQEEVFEFINTYVSNPAAILEKIRPKKSDDIMN